MKLIVLGVISKNFDEAVCIIPWYRTVSNNSFILLILNDVLYRVRIRNKGVFNFLSPKYQAIGV